ncbi:alpha/beta hydrolase [Roseateles sp. SL47]|uniref:alpha/beta fold hydrolase n=1 Tax=Roseateles sp. SL47 TaxID=2995138 RepID=UPI00226FBDF6|nr:alpha/beta hydrolase [Roseateles sp. SL47]WAC73503.1 alpha/beta hydrolase [Roseateles sp. SL47]
MATFPKIKFLPGASGNTEFWKPVAAAMQVPEAITEHLGWPGLGPTPVDPAVSSLDDLVAQLSERITEPTALVAQSMGGVVALKVALKVARDRPHLITHLVLAALSGGIDVQRHGARDWRPARAQLDPGNPSHLFARYDGDLTPALASIQIPTLLLWGGADPISPVAVGQWLSGVLPRSALHVVEDGDHSFCHSRADGVAPLIARHLVSGG